MRAHFNPRHDLGLPAGHRFPESKYRLLRERVAAELPQIELVEARPASDRELGLVHSPGYVDAVVRGGLAPAALREIGFPWSAVMVERSRRSVGATIEAARTALDEGVAAQLGGGTHHASASRGAGWCVFNDVAVAARCLQSDARGRVHLPLHVWVIDLDVHQGDGTAAIFRDDPTVFTLSVHGAKNFPFRKQPGDLDVELPDGCADDDYLRALDDALDTAWARQGERRLPGLAFYLAGADPHVDDRLGRLSLSAGGLAERDRRVFAFLRERGVPVAVTMAGGYGVDVSVTVAIHLRTLALAHECWRAWPGRRPS